MADPVDPSVAGLTGSPGVTLEERSAASRSKSPDRTDLEPTKLSPPPESRTNEPAGSGPQAPTAGSSAPTPRVVELPHSNQSLAAALTTPAAVTQSTTTATGPPVALHSRAPPPQPRATAVLGSTPPPPPCVAAPSPPARPAYLAAGVLPFCVLGGDLLFLLGQQLRFRSRVRGSRSFPEVGGVSTFPAAAEGEGLVASAAARQSPPRTYARTRQETTPLPSGTPPPPPPPSVWRPRRGPRPKVSLSLSPGSSGSALSGQPPGDASPLPPAAAAAAAGAQASRQTAAAKVEEGAPPSSYPVAGASKDGTRHGMQTGACRTRGEGGGDIGTAREPSEAAVQENDLKVNATDSPSRAGDPSAPHGTAVKTGRRPGGINPEDGSSNTTVLSEEAPPAAATGDPHPPVEQTVAAPGQGTVPAGLLWSDFGGAREAGDADAEETASREFAEESFGIFHGVRLESDSVARSQATMSSALRDPSLRGKRVFECRNGGYVMFVAEVDFVPDLMINLARKEIVGEDDDSGPDAGGVQGDWGGSGQGQASSPGFSEKTDFAWVPASVLLRAMRESRNRSTRKVVVKLGGCRYLRLFHKFVISLWGLDLAAVIQAASTPLLGRRASLPRPRILLVKSNAGAAVSRCDSNQDETNGDSSDGATSTERCAAIRGIDCVRPSFLSGRKRTSLGIIDVRRDRRWDGGGGSARGAAGSEDGEAGSESGNVSGGGGGAGDGLRSGRSRKSGAACRKRRRQCKQARRLKAAVKAEAAAEAARVSCTAVPPVAADVVPAIEVANAESRAVAAVINLGL